MAKRCGEGLERDLDRLGERRERRLTHVRSGERPLLGSSLARKWQTSAMSAQRTLAAGEPGFIDQPSQMGSHPQALPVARRSASK